MKKFPALLKAFAKDETGAAAIEYGILLGLMVLAIIGASTRVASANNDVYSIITDNVQQTPD